MIYWIQNDLIVDCCMCVVEACLFKSVTSKILLYLPNCWKKSLQPNCYADCYFSLKIHLVNNAIPKMSREERSELKRKFQRIENERNSPEITTSVVPNLNIEIPSTNPDEQPPVEHFEEEAVGDFTETMM